MNGSQAAHRALSQALAGALSGAPPAHVLGEAVELSPATRGLMAAHPDRVHLLPAADATLVGVGVGLALSGQAAVVELADADALWGAVPQLSEAGRLHSAEQPVSLVVRVPCGPDGGTPERVAAALPDSVAIACPATAADVGPVLRAALRAGRPVVVLEPRAVLAEVGDDADDLPLGAARVRRTGVHATVIALGDGVRAALAAADSLADQGIEIDVVDLRSLRPLDAATVAARVHETGRPVFVGAVDSAVLAVVDAAFLRLESPPARVPADADATTVAAAVRASLSY
ncbi:MAG: hypothetical protein H6742_21015 [Alphaproteobacteria bacterium]|nr:hypothetical protein [Alphaproteobacteria bacterium]